MTLIPLSENPPGSELNLATLHSDCCRSSELSQYFTLSCTRPGSRKVFVTRPDPTSGENGDAIAGNYTPGKLGNSYHSLLLALVHLRCDG